MKIGMQLEINNVHDAVMLDTLIDLWKDYWSKSEAEVEDDDAEDEQGDRDVEYPDDEAEAEAHRKALDELAKAMRNAGVAEFSFTHMGNAKRRNDRS